ncbi:MAG: hypothetical protein H9855_02875 [Candidatus Acinetobacter avistercoris]|nr:hypothetical protein [Candidatus Acinetobacter avistercoris]
MKVPEKIQLAFIQFIFCGGYKVKPTPCGVQYYKAGKDALFIGTNCQMNEAMKARWNLFCKMWLKNGKEFLDGLGVK